MRSQGGGGKDAEFLCEIHFDVYQRSAAFAASDTCNGVFDLIGYTCDDGCISDRSLEMFCDLVFRYHDSSKRFYFVKSPFSTQR